MSIKTKLFLQTIIPVLSVTVLGIITALWITISQHNQLVTEALSSNLSELRTELDQSTEKLEDELTADLQNPNLISSIRSLSIFSGNIPDLKRNIQCKIINLLRGFIRNKNYELIALYNSKGLNGYATQEQIYIVEPAQGGKEYIHFKPSADSILSHCISKQWIPIKSIVKIPNYIPLPQTVQIQFITIDDELYIEGIVSIQNIIYTELGEEKKVISGSVLLRKKVGNDFILKFSQKTMKKVDLFSPSGILLLGSNMGIINRLEVPVGQATSQGAQFFDIDLGKESYYVLLKPYEFNRKLVAYMASYTSKEIAKKSTRKVIFFQIGGLFVGLLFALLLTLAMGRVITQPIVDITKQMNKFTTDEVLDQKISIHSKDEIGLLADTFNKMAFNLMQRNSEKKQYIRELSDINERLDESEKKYRSIFENARDGIFQITQEGNILIANPSLLAILGYNVSANTIIGSVDSDENIRVNLVEQDEFNHLMESQGFVKDFEAGLFKSDGSIIPVSISAYVVFNDNEEINYYEGILEDITEKKRTEELRISKETAEAANRAKSNFLANMSHELRTPLNAVIGFANIMAKSRALSSDDQKNLDIIRRSGEHLLTLINDILDLSRIEAGKVGLNEQDFDLHKMLEDLELMFELKTQEKDLQLTFSRKSNVPQHIKTDQVKLRQVLINLIGNAIKFTLKGGITVTIYLKNNSQINIQEARPITLYFEVRDTGPGIAPEEMDRVFESFGQTATGRQAQEGTGLGLPLSRKFVQLMGGDIQVESEVGHGTTVTFDIHAKVMDTEDLAQTVPALRVIALEPGQPRHRLLIVDDSRDNRQLLVSLLAPLGFELSEATNGQEAVDICEAWKPHMIFIDIRMPVMDGLEATKRIRTLASGTPRPVIVAVTASVFEEKQAEVLSGGCDDFVSKPFNEQEIYEKIQKHLGIRYVYEKEPKAAGSRQQAGGKEVLTPAALAALPAEWLDTLKQGARRADFILLSSVIEQIRGQDSALADALELLVKDFQYDALLALIQ